MSDKIYTPDELYFSFVEDDDVDFPMGRETVIYIGFRDKELEEKGEYTGGHNVNTYILSNCGVCPYELMESHFELEDDFVDRNTIINLLTDAGFEYREEQPY